MATFQDLRASISNLLNNCGYPGSFILRNGADDAAFEAYVFMLVVRAFENLGASIDFRGIRNENVPPPSFIFRGSPGYIYSRDVDYGFAICRYKGGAYEIHLDVQHAGSSGVLHELDISIISREEGQKCRARAMTPSHPRARNTKGAVECKFYRSSLSLQFNP